MVMLDLTTTALDAASLAAACRAQGVLVSTLGPQRVRLVTHLDVADDGIDRALEALLPSLT